MGQFEIKTSLLFANRQKKVVAACFPYLFNVNILCKMCSCLRWLAQDSDFLGCTVPEVEWCWSGWDIQLWGSWIIDTHPSALVGVFMWLSVCSMHSYCWLSLGLASRIFLIPTMLTHPAWDVSQRYVTWWKWDFSGIWGHLYIFKVVVVIWYDFSFSII